MERYVHTMSAVEAFLAHRLASLARVCARRPKTTLLVFTVTSIYLMAGLLLLTTEEGTRALWTDQNSEEMANLNFVEGTFSARARLNQLYVTGDANAANVVTFDRMRAVLEMHDEVMALRLADGRGYLDICEPAAGSATGCNIAGAPRFWGFNRTEFLAVEADDTTVSQTCAGETYPNGQSVVRDVDFGKFELFGVNETQLRARALVLIYFVDPADEEAALEWETLFIEVGLKARAQLDVRVNAERSTDDELAVSVGGDFMLVGATYVMMIAFVSVTLGRPCHALDGRWALASGDVLAIIFAVFAAYGLVAATGTPFTSLAQVIPFILIGVGIDSAYVIVAAFDRTPLSMGVPDRVYESVYEAGMSITVTSGTNFIAFVFAAFTRLPAVQIFGKFAACSIAFIYVVHITVFPALLALDAKRVRSGRRDMLCCLKISGAGGPVKPLGRPPSLMTVPEGEDSTSAGSGPNNAGQEDEEGSAAASSRMRRWFRDTYAPWLLRPVTKACVVVAFVTMTAVGGWQASKLENSFSLTTLAPDDSYLQDFYALQQELYGALVNGQPIGLFFKEVDYTSRAVQEEIRRVSDELLAADRVDADKGRLDWHLAFTEYARAQPALATQIDNGFLAGSGFYTEVDSWLALPLFERFQTSLVRDATTKRILASRIIVFLENGRNSEEDVESLVETTGVAANSSLAPDVFVSASSFVFYDQYRFIVPLAVQTFLLAVLAVVLVTALLLVHPLMVLICAVNLSMMFACLLGSVTLFWDIALSSVSLTTLLMSISLLVDASVHIIYTFGTLEPTLSRDERVKQTLFNVGPAVFLALSTTVLGVLPLVLAQSAIFRIFLEVFISIGLFGGLFGMVFLPVVLSLIGPAVWRPEHLLETKQSHTNLHLSVRPSTRRGRPVPEVMESSVSV